MSGEMIKRVISATIIIAVAVLAICFGGAVFHIAVLAITLLGIFEIKKALKKVEINTMLLINYIYAVAAALAVYLGEGVFVFPMLLLFSVIAFSISMLLPKYTVKDAIATVFVFIYPTTLMLLLNVLEKYGRVFIIAAIIASVITDTAAFFIGRKFGQAKLCPDISPNKTVAGALGGAAATFVLLPIYGLIFITGVKNIGVVDVAMWILLALLCGIFAQLGDLFASSIKRYCDIKDFSKLIPGHGGILDRLDSIMFTAMLVYLFRVLGII